MHRSGGSSVPGGDTLNPCCLRRIRRVCLMSMNPVVCAITCGCLESNQILIWAGLRSVLVRYTQACSRCTRARYPEAVVPLSPLLGTVSSFGLHVDFSNKLPRMNSIICTRVASVDEQSEGGKRLKLDLDSPMNTVGRKSISCIIGARAPQAWRPVFMPIQGTT